MTHFAQARKNMVDCQIHTANVVTPAVMAAFGSVPREKFVPAHMTGIAYCDEDVALGKNRFLLAPAVQARMMEAVQPAKTDLVLDIGGGTGYAAVILSMLCEHVTALEERADFTTALNAATKGLRIQNITAVTGPLTAGHVAGSPYDLIFVNGAISSIPDSLSEQLKPGGRLIAVFKDSIKAGGATMGQVVILRRNGVKQSGGELSSYPLFEAGCATLPGYEPRTSFNFGR
ncbi:MAG: protein-L-isoaspartate O-methyltransferase family protein [Alphaproteobacteria bacterium]